MREEVGNGNINPLKRKDIEIKKTFAVPYFESALILIILIILLFQCFQKNSLERKRLS